MRRGLLELCLIIVVVIGIHAERLLHNGSIEGRISPRRSFLSVIAVRVDDSLKLPVKMAILEWTFNLVTGN